MGRWAQSRRVGTGKPVVGPLPIPDFFFVGTELVNWNVVGVVPNTAQIEMSDDEVTWFVNQTQPWGDGPVDLIGEGFFRLIGLDLSGLPCTQYSINLVQ